jgi:iduronate 2-sulfatase
VINIHHILILTIGLSLLTIHKINAQEKESKPNILLIMVDDLNDYQGAFGGHPQALTPNIDRLAETGTRFKNAHTNVPVCSPSRNSLFTGVYPHKSRDFVGPLISSNMSLKITKLSLSFLKRMVTKHLELENYFIPM